MVFSPITKPKIEAWDPSLHYIAWAQPGTLIPVINAKRQEDLLPVLDLSYPPKKKHQPACTEHHFKHDPSHRPDESRLLLDDHFFPEHSHHHTAGNSPEIPSQVGVHKDQEEPEHSFRDLWAYHEHEVSRLRQEDFELHTAEKFFAWLDEKTHKNDFEFQVWSRLKKDLENKLRYRLEFCHRKMHNVEYRTPLEKLMVTVPSHSSVFPDKPPEVARAITEPRDEVTRNVIFDKILVFNEPRFRSRFPAVVNKDFPGRTKLAFKRLAKLIVQSEQNEHIKGGTDESGGNNSPVRPFEEDEYILVEHGKTGKKTKGGKKAKRKASTANSKHPVGEREDASDGTTKGTRKSKKHKKTKGQTTSKNDGGRKSPGQNKHSNKPGGKNKLENSAATSAEVREKSSKGPKNGRRKRNYSLLTDSSIDWAAPPVAPKRGVNEHYTKDEILALQKHTRVSYNFKLKSDGHPDISGADVTVQSGPPLPSPAIIRMMEEIAWNKRYRLTDLFAYGDKDKSWRLNPVKVRNMLDTLGIEQVSEQAITDFFVKLDDFSEQTVNFKDVKTAMHVWIKEKRVRKRYCMEVAGETVMADMRRSIASPVLAVHSTEMAKENLPVGTSAVQKYVQDRNPHPLPVPDQIGTEVCDIPGDICQWNTVFPEDLVLAWRVQQKLEKLYQDRRWLEAKTALKVFGHLRHLNRGEIPTEEEPPQQIPVQNANLLDEPSSQLQPVPTLENLAQGVISRIPLLDQMSHTEMHKRLSLSELEKGVPSYSPEAAEEPPPKRRHKYQKIMEEEARIKTESPSLNLENPPDEIEVQKSDEDLSGKEVMAKTTRSLILSGLRTDPADPTSESAKFPPDKRMKRSIVANEEERADRTELDRYLRRRFRVLYNPVQVDPEYGDVLEVLKFRAFNKLKESAKEEKERLQAALDPARINDTACQLVQDVENILIEAKKNMNTSVNLSGPPNDQEKLCHLRDLRKEEIKKKLLLEAKGLPRTPLSLMDSKTKALAFQVKRLKSSLDVQAPDIRKCSSSSLASSSYRSENSTSSVCPARNRTGSTRPDTNTHDGHRFTQPHVAHTVNKLVLPVIQHLEVSPKAHPQKVQDPEVVHAVKKQPNRRRVLHSTGVEIGFVLDFYFSRHIDHYLKGMDKNIKKQAQKLKISRYQPLTIVERRLIQRQKFTKTNENYYHSVNQDAQALFRKMHQRIERKNLAEMFPDDMLRRVMLRQEDKSVTPVSYKEAFAKFRAAVEQEFGGRFPSRIPRNRSKRFYSLPTFFPLRDNAELLKTTHG